MVSRQDSKTAGKDRKRFCDAEFRGEVCHQWNVFCSMLARKPSRAATCHIPIERLRHVIQLGQKSFVRRCREEALLIHLPQHGCRIMATRLPQVAVQTSKQTGGLMAPGPAEVVSQIA